MITIKPTIYFSEQGRDVFVAWDPKGTENLHRITILRSGDFEVRCCHRFYDEGNIRAQIKHLIAEEKIAKKNN